MQEGGGGQNWKSGLVGSDYLGGGSGRYYESTDEKPFGSRDHFLSERLKFIFINGIISLIARLLLLFYDRDIATRERDILSCAFHSRLSLHDAINETTERIGIENIVGRVKLI